MSWFGGNPWATLAVAGPIPALYQVQQNAQKDQASALRAARDEDARKVAEASTGAAVAANAAIAEAKRRRRASALGLGNDSAADGLGAPASTAGGGAAGAALPLSSAYSGGGAAYGSALGAAIPSVGYSPRSSSGGASRVGATSMQR